MPQALRLLPSLPKKTPDPDETPTVPAVARAATITLDDLEDVTDADRRARDIDTILVSYILDLDRVI
ncbi:MAG TPA: hypothetical protein VL463_06550 [Kofleriaceae bacterium]|jgi:hypothetical protein|nr:hypothetical protein [Kofleriaceae bacterium]